MLKSLYIGVGTVSLCIGIIGIVVPVLPTTPFLLLSAACYAKGSQRIYLWMINIKWIGRYIKNYHEGKGISFYGKLVSIIFLWTMILSTMFIMANTYILQLILCVIAIGVTIHIMSLKTMKDKGI